MIQDGEVYGTQLCTYVGLCGCVDGFSGFGWCPCQPGPRHKITMVTENGVGIGLGDVDSINNTQPE